MGTQVKSQYIASKRWNARCSKRGVSIGNPILNGFYGFEKFILLISVLNVCSFRAHSSTRINREWYRSGHNGADSKSAMYSDAVSVENPVVMRVFSLWKFHNHFVSALNVCPFSKRHSVKIIMERYRRGHNGADSKSCGELSVSSTKNLVTMRVLPGSKIE